MAILDRGIQARLDEVVMRWNLHEESDIALPVPIQLVARHEGWRIGWGCEWPLYGFAIYNRETRIMRLNEALSDDWIRFTIAHEMGHEIAGHGYGEYTYKHGVRDAREREADLVAMELLIPPWLRQEALSCIEIAERCRVPLTHVRWFRTLEMGDADGDDAPVSQCPRGASRDRSARTRGMAIGRKSRSAA